MVNTPGEILREILAARKWRQSDLAERASLSPKHVNQIVNGSIGITGDVAVRFERTLGVAAAF